MNHTVSLTENYRFRALYAHGKNYATRTVAVYVQKNRLKTKSRLGITASTKLGKAVTRNLLRRRIREAYRIHETEFAQGYDIVVVARRGAIGAPFAVIERDLLYSFRKLSILKEA